MAIRVLRQRLAQWIEDLSSAGGTPALIAAVQQLVERLTAALAASAALHAELIAITEALIQLATGAAPPPGAKKSRLAFWK